MKVTKFRVLTSKRILWPCFNLRLLEEASTGGLDHPDKRLKVLEGMHARNAAAAKEKAEAAAVEAEAAQREGEEEEEEEKTADEPLPNVERCIAIVLQEEWETQRGRHLHLTNLTLWAHLESVHRRLWHLHFGDSVTYPEEDMREAVKNFNRMYGAGGLDLVLSHLSMQPSPTPTYDVLRPPGTRDEQLKGAAARVAEEQGEELNVKFLPQFVHDRPLHRELWALKHPDEPYPSDPVWAQARAVRDSMACTLAEDVERDLRETRAFAMKVRGYTPSTLLKLIREAALYLRGRDDFWQEAKQSLTQLRKWYDRRELHAALWAMEYPSRPGPSFHQWRTAKMELLALRAAALRMKTRKGLEGGEGAEEQEEEGMEVDSESKEEKGMIDLSAPRHNRRTKKANFSAFTLGDGFSLVHDTVTFSANGQHGSYEAVQLVKTLTPDGDKVKTLKQLTFNMPIRTLPALHEAVKGIRNGIEKTVRSPTLAQLREELKRSGDMSADLTGMATTLPMVAYKIDDLLTLKAELAKWGKCSVEVITFTRRGKDSSKKDFSLQLPAKLFPALETAISYMLDANKDRMTWTC